MSRRLLTGKGYRHPAGGGSPYVGSGDIVAAASWYGLRAYSFATIGANLCDIVRASDSASQTFGSVSDGSLDVASIATFLAATTGKFSKFWDQVGSLHLTQGTGANRPAYVASGVGTRSIARFAGGQTIENGSVPGTFISQPVTILGVAKRTATTFSQENLFYANGEIQVGYAHASAGGANTNYGYFNGAATVNGVCSDTVWHSCMAIGAGGAGFLYTDGSSTGFNAGAGSNGAELNYSIGGNFGGGTNFNGDFVELGVYSSDIHTNAAALSSNAQAFYGY